MIRKRATALDVYIAAIVIAGAVLLVWSAAGLPSTPHASEWGILAGLALVASRFPLRMPGRNAYFSISDTFFMASAILFGPGPATLTIAVDSALMTRAFKTFSLRRLLFNSGAVPLTLWGGWQAFTLLAGAQPFFGLGITVDELVVPVAGLALVYY